MLSTNLLNFSSTDLIIIIYKGLCDFCQRHPAPPPHEPLAASARSAVYHNNNTTRRRIVNEFMSTNRGSIYMFIYTCRTGHCFQASDVHILDRQDRGFRRGVRGATYVHLEGPSLNTWTFFTYLPRKISNHHQHSQGRFRNHTPF